MVSRFFCCCQFFKCKGLNNIGAFICISIAVISAFGSLRTATISQAKSLETAHPFPLNSLGLHPLIQTSAPLYRCVTMETSRLSTWLHWVLSIPSLIVGVHLIIVSFVLNTDVWRMGSMFWNMNFWGNGCLIASLHFSCHLVIWLESNLFSNAAAWLTPFNVLVFLVSGSFSLRCDVTVFRILLCKSVSPSGLWLLIS